jgi:hypothetical protein
MNNLPPPQSQSTSGIRTRSKGKARELPTGTPDAPHAQRGTKRPAVEDSPSPESPDPEPTAPMAVDDEVTPRKPNAPPSADLPLVLVDEGSPRPTRRARIESGGAVATGKVRM